jgi:proline iminopeptidase
MDQGEEIARLVPGAELAVFEHSGHSPQIEERAAFTRRLATFLTSRSSARL